MLFNSIEFLLFLPFVFVTYWLITGTGGELRSRTGRLRTCFAGGGTGDFSA